MTGDLNRSGAPGDDSPRVRRPYVAPRLGDGRSVRELTRAASGSFNDGNTGSGQKMQMTP
jgi:hypothetical protein